MTISVDTAEQALVGRAASGDRDAFSLLIESHMRRAYRVALAIVGSPDDALDLAQEAFACAYQARHRLDPNRPFSPWLHQIVRRLCFNFLRDRRTRRDRLAEASGWIVDARRALDAERSPERELVRHELRLRVARAIEGLPERDREVLVLKEFEGLKYREIADTVGIPIGTVMSRLYSARRRLVAALEETP